MINPVYKGFPAKSMIDMRRKFDHRRTLKKFFEQRRVGMKAPRTFGVQNLRLEERNEFFGHARFVHPMDVLQWGLKKMKPSGLLGLMRIDFI